MKRFIVACSLVLFPVVSFAGVTVTSDDVLFDGVPRSFDIKRFSSSLEKELSGRVPVGTDVNLVIRSVAHKVRVFHFKAQYVVTFSYSVADNKTKAEAINEDQRDLIDEICDEVVKSIKQ